MAANDATVVLLLSNRIRKLKRMYFFPNSSSYFTQILFQACFNTQNNACLRPCTHRFKMFDICQKQLAVVHFCRRLSMAHSDKLIYLCKLLKAQQGHEHTTSILLRRNVDVTVVDESGRTAVDMAQNRWIQTALRQAWNDATRHKLEVESVTMSNLEAMANGQLPPPVSPPPSITESPPEQLKSPEADTPRARSGKLVKPFVRQSRSLDQTESVRDMNHSPSIHVTRVGARVVICSVAVSCA